VLGATVAGCIKIPPFQGGGDAGSDGTSGDAMPDASMYPPGAYAVPVSGGVQVFNQPLYTLGFSPDGYHFPQSMTVGPTNIVGGGTSTCNGPVSSLPMSSVE